MTQQQKLGEAEIAEMMKDYVLPTLPAKCPWKAGIDPKLNPHNSYRNIPHGKVYSNILELVGNTPLVKLNKIPQSLGIEADIYVKCEFFNPGGSVKERAAVRMVEDAEKDGSLKPGSTIIEATSGNAGIGLAMAATVKDYHCILLVPEKTSKEKVAIMKVLGAQVILIPMSAHYSAPDGMLGMAHILNKQIPKSVALNQFSTASNPMVHYDTTAEEILEAFDGKVDMYVAGIGSGGTLSGVARKMKEKCPECVIVGVDPWGSIHALPESGNKFDKPFVEAEGFNYYLTPTTLDRESVDRWVKVGDKESFAIAKRLIREEGILGGSSSAFNLNGGLIAAKSLKKGQKCVVILPDDTKNYVSTLASEQWLEAMKLQPCINHHNYSWWDIKVSELNLKSPQTLTEDATCQEALNIMTKHNLEQIPVVYKDSPLISMITIRSLMEKLMSKFAEVNDSAKKVGSIVFLKVTEDDSLGLVSRVMEIEQYVLVTKKVDGKDDIAGIITNLDFLHYITKNYSL